MSNVECRNYILNIIERIEDSRSTQTEIDQIYKDIVYVFTSEMTKIFGIKNNNPYSNKRFHFIKKEWWDEGLILMFKEMQQAEHANTKAKKNKQNFKRQQAEFKMKQNQFDKCVKRKKWAFDREHCMQLEEINSSDPNSFWEYINKLSPKSKTPIPMECYAMDGSIIWGKCRCCVQWSIPTIPTNHQGLPGHGRMPATSPALAAWLWVRHIHRRLPCPNEIQCFLIPRCHTGSI